MKFTKVEVGPTWLYKETHTGSPYETELKFNRPTVDRDYIKILARCLSYADKNIIYPGVRNPLMYTVRDLCRHGYLERFIADGKRNRYYYKTTMKGVGLLLQALNT